MNTDNIFRPDAKQAIAVVAMVAAVFLFALGETVFGAVAFAVAAAFSLGGLFWDAHRRDRTDAAEMKARASVVSPPADPRNPQGKP